jgi:hypothetical protein
MNPLPQRHPLFEVNSRAVQNPAYIRPVRVRRTNRIHPIAQGHISIGAQIDNRFRFAHKPMNVPRRMVVGIHNKANAVERARSHGFKNPSRMG